MKKGITANITKVKKSDIKYGNSPHKFLSKTDANVRQSIKYSMTRVSPRNDSESENGAISLHGGGGGNKTNSINTPSQKSINTKQQKIHHQHSTSSK